MTTVRFHILADDVTKMINMKSSHPKIETIINKKIEENIH
jgi:hypothetical protein